MDLDEVLMAVLMGAVGVAAIIVLVFAVSSSTSVTVIDDTIQVEQTMEEAGVMYDSIIGDYRFIKDGYNSKGGYNGKQMIMQDTLKTVVHETKGVVDSLPRLERIGITP